MGHCLGCATAGGNEEREKRRKQNPDTEDTVFIENMELRVVCVFGSVKRIRARQVLKNKYNAAY